MIDSNDRERIGEARDELGRMLAEDELRDAVLLIFANKQDLPNAMNSAEITEKLGLNALRQRNWYIQVSLCATLLDARSSCLAVDVRHDWRGTLRGSGLACRAAQEEALITHACVVWY